MLRLLSLLLAFGLGVIVFWAAEYWGQADRPVPVSESLKASPDLTIVLSPSFLTQLLQKEVEESDVPIPVQDIRVASGPDRLVIQGRLEGPVSPVGIIEAQPFTHEGRLQLRLVQGSVGSVLLPEMVVRLLEEEINVNLTNILRPYPVALTGVETDESGLTVTAEARS